MTPAWKMRLPDDWRAILERECRDVTICIAVGCNHSRDGGKKLVLCTDWRVSSFLGSADIRHKQNFIARGFHCLIAGDPREVDIVMLGMREKFKAPDSINETNLRPLVEEAFYERLKERRNGLAQARFSMSHADVIQFGKERLPAEHYIRYLDDSAKIGLDTQFLVTGFGEGSDDLIVEVRQNEVSMPDSFACIGEGEFLARASLLRREINFVSKLGDALYAVYEAKKAAERVGSVGKNTLISVIGEDGDRHSIPPPRQGFLEKLYAEYGPKRIGEITLPSDLFDE
jgi:hypothetical protein